MKRLLLPISLLLVAISSSVFFAAPVQAQVQQGQEVTICTFIRPICQALGLVDANGNLVGNPEGQVQSFVRNRAQLILSLVFIGIVLIAVYIIISNGIKYIQSQGDEGKIKAATKAIKTVFVGIAVLFIGIAGLVLVLVAFNATGLLNQQPVPGGCIIDPLSGFVTCP